MSESLGNSTPGSPGSIHELADHCRVLVRPLQLSDRHELAIGYEHLSAEARRRRFFTAPSRLSEADLEYLTDLDYRDHFAWAAFAIDERGQPGIGVARYIRDPTQPDQAEVAVTVLDDYQHRGLGTLLLEMLADHARDNGITTFVSHILWDNREILETLAAAGARIEPEEPGVARVAIEIPPHESPTLLGLIRATLRAFGRATREILEVTAEPKAEGSEVEVD
ncbi:MAG: GNAT family N-acetyltransferase [Acidimicrobiales bacterium]|jgi:GNAT superfamily N-acetyltransferase